MLSRNSLIALLFAVPLLLANDGGCHPPDAAQVEAKQQDAQMDQFLRNQPVPSFDYSLERQIVIEVYAARQRQTVTFSYIQSPYTGKILWQCPSYGFPIPYSTQLTNPQKLTLQYGLANSTQYTGGVVSQQEPNGLFPPPSSEATIVPCVDDKGNITPVYKEPRVETSPFPIMEVNGEIVRKPNTKSSIEILSNEAKQK